jgi:hypothetical protein
MLYIIGISLTERHARALLNWMRGQTCSFKSGDQRGLNVAQTEGFIDQFLEKI